MQDHRPAKAEQTSLALGFPATGQTVIDAFLESPVGFLLFYVAILIARSS